VLDEKHVEAVVVRGIDEQFEEFVRPFGGRRLFDEAQPFRHPVYVRIDRHSRPAEREK
jgi:hypothetical protein